MADVKKIKGRIEINVDDEGLLAVLHYIPDENGIEYDLQAVNRLITEKNIVHGIKRKELDDKLAAIFSSPSESTITLAEGEPAEMPAADERIWSELPVPESLEDDAAAVLKNASPPEIYRTDTEKVRQEKIVKKRGGLPFGREKGEKVVETVSRETKTRVDIIPDVIEVGWVEAGKKIADIKPGSAGKPGRDVYGKPVQPPSAGDEFYIGGGIESKAGGYIAAETGFLRRGLNWAEVMPFKSHDWSLELSKDKNTCLLNFNPGGPESSPPDPAEIIERAVMLGCPEDTLLSASEINGIISAAISTGRDVKSAVISTDDDGFFEIRVSEDRLKAELVMHKGRGSGNPLVLKQAGAAIKTSGLKQLDLKEIQELILEFYRGPEADAVIPLCTGIPAEDGKAGETIFQLEFMGDAAAGDIKKRIAGLPDGFFSSIESAGKYPPADADALAVVQAGQQIAAIEAEEGKKGIDVYGAELSFAATDLSAVRTLENAELSGGRITAGIKGLLERFDCEGVTVFRVREHADCEMKVEVSADRMKAVFSAFPPLGTGAPPSLEEANRIISEAAVINGLDPAALRDAVERCRSGERVTGAVVACGTPAKNAGEAVLKWHIELAGGEAVSIDKSGRADYRKQNRITAVSEGDLIAEIKQSGGESEDGRDVYGKIIPAVKKRPLSLEIGAGIREETSGDGSILLEAEKNGRVIYENNRIEIQESLFIKGDVDFSTGNIKFGGDVSVKGSVRSGFYVMAGGNIRIGMNSEMSLLSSGKSIAVDQGIKGGGRAVLRAKDSIQLSFAENAVLLAVADVTVKNAVFGCRVKCNGKLRLVSEKGYLIGGRIQAREGIEARNIGSISGSRTEVSFGQDYLVGDRIETEEKEIDRLKDRLVKIDPEMKQAERYADQKRLSALRAEKVKLMKIMEKRSMRVFALKERFEQHFPGEVVIRGEVYPGVMFESHGRTLEITKNSRAVKIIFNRQTGMLEQVPLETKNE